MGTPEFATPSLERLIRDGHDLRAIFTQPDKPAGRGNHLHPPPIKQVAVEHGLPVYQPPRIKNNDDVRKVFVEGEADACIVAAYGKILPEWLLAIPRLGCINVHSSLLPKFRGAAPINWAIAAGESETGVTIMQMDAGMDTGPTLSQRATQIGNEETAIELTGRLALIGADLLAETLPAVENGSIRRVEQDATGATYAPILKREDGLIDWRLSAREIANRVRAFQPWPGSYTLFHKGRLIIWAASPVTEPVGPGAPGIILAIGKNSGLQVGCGGGTILSIHEIQVEGKRRTSARDFANGMRLAVGDRITDAEN